MTPTEQSTSEGRAISEPRGQALILHKIELAAEPTGDFERVMLDEVFPAVNTGDENSPDKHMLLSNAHPAGEYTWASIIGYDIHHTPMPTWLMGRPRQAADAAAPFLEGIAEILESTVHYNVANWRAIVGD